MELAIYRKKSNNRLVTTIMVVICLICLIPSAIVLASALTQPYIGMAGVNNSDLTVGMQPFDDSSRLIDYGGTWHLNPNSSAFQLANLLPLIFLVVGILLVWYMIEKEQPGVRILIVIAILIYFLLALLPSIQEMVTNLLGG